MSTCRHVYEYVGAPTCPDCGKNTHETNWRQINDARKQWWADGKADWSICPDCGGTLRGWWSI